MCKHQHVSGIIWQQIDTTSLWMPELVPGFFMYRDGRCGYEIDTREVGSNNFAARESPERVDRWLHLHLLQSHATPVTALGVGEGVASTRPHL